MGKAQFAELVGVIDSAEEWLYTLPILATTGLQTVSISMICVSGSLSTQPKHDDTSLSLSPLSLLSLTGLRRCLLVSSGSQSWLCFCCA